MKQCDSEKISRLHSEFCSVFTNEKRLLILFALEKGSKCVGELAKEVGLTSQMVSQHLRLMKGVGAVISIREGRKTFYQITNRKFIDGYKMIKDGVIEECLKRSSDLQEVNTS